MQEIAAILARAIEKNGDDYNLYIPLENALENLGQTEAVRDVRQQFKKALSIAGI